MVFFSPRSNLTMSKLDQIYHHLDLIIGTRSNERSNSCFGLNVFLASCSGGVVGDVYCMGLGVHVHIFQYFVNILLEPVKDGLPGGLHTWDLVFQGHNTFFYFCHFLLTEGWVHDNENVLYILFVGSHGSFWIFDWCRPCGLGLIWRHLVYVGVYLRGLADVLAWGCWSKPHQCCRYLQPMRPACTVLSCSWQGFWFGIQMIICRCPKLGLWAVPCVNLICYMVSIRKHPPYVNIVSCWVPISQSLTSAPTIKDCITFLCYDKYITTFETRLKVLHTCDKASKIPYDSYS